MSGNIRSRRAFNNAYGNNGSDNDNKSNFPTQGTGPFSNPSTSPSFPFQNQGAFHQNSPPPSGFGTSRNVSISEGSLRDGSNSSNRSFPTSSNVVSSPFTPKQSSPTNPAHSPFSNTTSVPNPNLTGNYSYSSATSIPNQHFGAGSNDYYNTQQNLNPPNPPVYSNHTQFNLNNTSFLNQSQPKPQSHEDMTKMYLDSQQQNTFFPQQNYTSPNPPVNPVGLNQNLNAINLNHNLNQNTVNLSTISRSNDFGQSNRLNNTLAPLPGQLGAQLTKFGEIYNQRLQQSEDDNLEDPPLLDELGINVVEIYDHLVAVVMPKRGSRLFVNYNDLSGPLLIFVTFAMALMFSGKICFSIIYVLSVFCNLGIYMLFNFLNENYISLSKTVTIMGYSLLPLCFTPIIWIFSRFIKIVCVLLVYACVLWSTVSASYLFQVELNSKSRFYFILYPILLYYTTFANIVIF